METPNKTERFTETSPKRLTGLSPEEVRALSPELRGLWSRQNDEENGDFAFLIEFVDDLYPLLRRHFKRMRAEVLNDFSKDADVPLFAAFDRLLSLIDRCMTDAAFLDRFRHAQGLRNESLGRRKAKQEAERDAKKAA